MGNKRSDLSKSLELYETASRSIAGGVNSNIRFWEQPHPLFFTSAQGPYLTDADGNEVIDYVMGQGPMLLGHRPPFVTKAVARQLDIGILYGAQHEAEIIAAELLTDLVPCAETVRFNMTGTEAVQAALRIARASTGRDKVLKFEGHYHGWADNVLSNVNSAAAPLGVGPAVLPHPESSGIPKSALQDLIVCPWNDSDILQTIVEANSGTIAAIIMEPIMANSGVVEPDSGYLEDVRSICNRNDIVLIFDEVITGFRVHQGGAQGLYGVTPDLTTMGKALASGFPIGCVVGREELFKGVAAGEVTHAGTFNATPISIAAACATLKHIQDRGDELYDSINSSGALLVDGLGEILKERGIGHLIQGRPSIFNLMFTARDSVKNHRDVLEADNEMLIRVLQTLIRNGVRIAGRGNVFLSSTHTKEVVEETLLRFEQTMDEMTP